MQKSYITYFSFFILTCFVTASCLQQPDIKEIKYSTIPTGHTKTIYSFAIHPLHNPSKLIEAYKPIINYLNSKLDTIHIDLEASRDYKTYESKYKNRAPDFLLPNPWQTIKAMEFGYKVIAMAGEPEDFKGIFIVRKDSKITSPLDLKNKTVSYPASTALAACIMPQYFLYKNGIDVNQDIKNVYVGSQESSIMNVYVGNALVGATWPPPWRKFQRTHPTEAADLKVIWETEHLVNNSVMVRDEIPESVIAKIKMLLLQLHTTEEGRTILANIETKKFIDAENSDYEIVKQYISLFEKNVRKIESK